MVKIECDNCHNLFEIYECYLKRKRKHRFCSKKCEANFKSYHNTIDNWEGGCISKSNGYKYIRYKGKEIEEHRLVMMKQIGRELQTNEHVHHINGNKLDNRIENLKLVTNVEHAKIHAKMKENKCNCLICHKKKKHHARGLCATCYHKVLMERRLSEYELKAKQI